MAILTEETIATKQGAKLRCNGLILITQLLTIGHSS